MKKLFFSLGILWSGWLFAQNNLKSYEYWFNNDYSGKQTVVISSAAQHHLITSLDVSGLPDGVNVLNIRYRDEKNIYSSILSKTFYKSSIGFATDKKIVEYEYWFNNDYSGKQTVAISPAAQHHLITNLDVSGLPDGVNVLNIRYKDEKNIYSSILSKTFYKSSIGFATDKKIVEYEYWFNNDYSGKQTVAISPAAQHHLITNLDVSGLPDGVNVLNIRYKDEKNIYSSVLSKTFYKKESSQIADNKISGYRYWLDDDFSNAVYVSIPTPSKQLVLLENIDLTKVPKGQHSIHFQFRDFAGLWSVVTTDIIEKQSFPIADFSYTTEASCDYTTVTFSNKSIDGDSYYWDFGDGSNSNIANPVHTYSGPGIYTVSLTVTDDVTHANNTKQLTITVIGNTGNSINVTACKGYLSPSKNYYFTSSGTYNDIIPNHCGCDSLITINLTIKTVNTSVTSNGSTLTANAANAAYQWLDCNNNFSKIEGETNQSFTPTVSGNYAVEVSQDGCIDTSACYGITIVSIFDNVFSDNIRIYPNPTSGNLMIDLGQQLSEISVEINDINGKVIRTEKFYNRRLIDMSLNEPAGIYFIKLVSDHNMAVFRVIKN
ncbi:MAG TPA: PKD domain-containing protein [Bacteroidales bacterium]|nr:PKD domain-containing protein [Bacteroidales bacterium]